MFLYLSASSIGTSCVKCVIPFFALQEIREFTLCLLEKVTFKYLKLGQDVWPQHMWRCRPQLSSLASKELRTSAPAERAERERDGWEKIGIVREWTRRRRRRRKRERVACVTACAVSVRVLTPAARPPSPLILWRALYQPGPFFPSLYLCLFPPPLSISCPLFSAFPFLLYFSSFSLFLLLWCRIFFPPGQRRCTADRGELNGWMDDGWMHCWSSEVQLLIDLKDFVYEVLVVFEGLCGQCVSVYMFVLKGTSWKCVIYELCRLPVAASSSPPIPPSALRWLLCSEAPWPCSCALAALSFWSAWRHTFSSGCLCASVRQGQRSISSSSFSGNSESSFSSLSGG